IYNAKFVPTETDDSLISSGGGIAFNPEWLKRNGYDNLSDLSILFPRTNRELWEKIGSSKENTEKSNEDDEDTEEDNDEEINEEKKNTNENEDEGNINEDSEENPENDDDD